MVCLDRSYLFKPFKGCLPQVLLGLFLNTLTHISIKIPELFQDSYFSKLFWVLALENTPGNKNTFKVDGKKETRTASVTVIRMA